MSKSRKQAPEPVAGRIARPLSLLAQVEQILREAIARGQFPGNRLPTEVELAEQLGVSRETVRRAAENLQAEGLLVKYRRKGTFTRPPSLQLDEAAKPTLIGYLQADYPSGQDRIEEVTPSISGMMLQGALAEAGQAGYELVVRHASPTKMGEAFRQLHEGSRIGGVIFASYGEEKLLRRVAGLALPTVLLDHDLHLPQVSSIRDDSQDGARQAAVHLAGLGHRRIAFAGWHRTDLNPWRLAGYRKGLREANLPRRRSWELEAELTEAGARQVVATWRGLSPRPTALLCFNNTLAKLIIEELHRIGLKTPSDLSVMGCGGEEVSGLTCHQADWFGMGRTAVKVLLQAIEKGPEFTPQHLVAPHSLRPGSTTTESGGE